MSLIYIKKIQRPDAQGVVQERFAVSAVSITTPQGKKLIPNPAGAEALLFEALSEAEAAVRHAGFDYEYEGQRTITFGAEPSRRYNTPEQSIHEAIPSLIRHLKDREPSVVGHSAFALGALRATEAVENLVALLGHDDAGVRKSVADALARLGGFVVPSLKAAFEQARSSPHVNAPYIRLTVMATLLEMSQIGQGAIVLGPGLSLALTGLDDDNWLVRSQAALVIGQVAMLQESLEKAKPH